MPILPGVRDGTTLPSLPRIPSSEVFPCSALVSCWPPSSPWPSCRWSAVPMGGVAAGPLTRPRRPTPRRAARALRPPPRSLLATSVRGSRTPGRPRAGPVPFLPRATSRSAPNFPARSTLRTLRRSNPRPYFANHTRPAFRRSFSGSAYSGSIEGAMGPAARNSKGNRMAWRKILERLDACWSAACIWFIRRSPLPADQSLRLLNRVSSLMGLPRPCPVRGR